MWIQFGDSSGVGIREFVQEIVGTVEEDVRESIGERLVLYPTQITSLSF